jgi:hypothetical protein
MIVEDVAGDIAAQVVARRAAVGDFDTLRLARPQSSSHSDRKPVTALPQRGAGRSSVPRAAS